MMDGTANPNFSPCLDRVFDWLGANQTWEMTSKIELRSGGS
jgi:hypothetical protein